MPAGGISVWLSALIGAVATALGRVIGAIPALLGAIVILLVGWGIGKLVQWLVVKGLHALHFDRVTEHAGIDQGLKRADVHADMTGILGVIAYWFVFLAAVYAAVGVLGIPFLSRLMETVVLYLPRVFAALVVVVFGAWAASFLGRLTRASASAANVQAADTLGSVVQGGVLFFTAAIALDMLGLAFPFLTTAFAVILGGIALAAALAFGLGGREYASDIMAGRALRTMYTPGDRVTTDDIDGTVQDIRPTTTVVRTTRGDVLVQNSDLMHKHAMRGPGRPGEGGSGMTGEGGMPHAA
jgi:small-conductance mechanosensitive channel